MTKLAYVGFMWRVLAVFVQVPGAQGASKLGVTVRCFTFLLSCIKYCVTTDTDSHISHQ